MKINMLGNMGDFFISFF